MRDYRKAALLAIIFSSTIVLSTASGRMSEMGDAKADAGALADSVAAGIWGGEHISLEVTEGGARIEYDCAHGTIDRALSLDRRGRFDVKGTHVEERGGPVREGASERGYPVRFTGQVSGRKMKLTVRRTDTKELIGTFTLVRGQEPFLVKCR
ncbi:MAG TPA: hypothetical protein VF754_01890 [Pyrinomonadaceae bacterium]